MFSNANRAVCSCADALLSLFLNKLSLKCQFWDSDAVDIFAQITLNARNWRFVGLRFYQSFKKSQHIYFKMCFDCMITKILTVSVNKKVLPCISEIQDTNY